jgi:putative membrane protein
MGLAFSGTFSSKVRPVAIIFAIGLGLGLGNARAEISDADKVFLDTMAASDTAEIELSRIVAAQALSPQVRDFAQTIASDHSENYQALLGLCRDKKYAVAPRVDAAHGEVMARLRSADTPEAAERAYLDAVAVDQANIDSLLERIAGNSNDADIARFAADTLSAVKNHEDSAKQLASK